MNDGKSFFIETEQLPFEERERIYLRAIAAISGTLPGPRIDTDYDPIRMQP